MQVFVILGIIGYVIVRIWKELSFTPEEENTNLTSTNEYYVYTQKDLNFSTNDLHTILHKHVTFYVTLSQEHQTTFIQRLNQFFNNKRFIICGTTPYKEMPILIGACAVQISFKLSDFTFSYFKNIIIQPKEYQSPHTENIIEGNVYGNSITIGFQNLVYDLKIHNDGHNVGLHEMAHALYVQSIYYPTYDSITNNPNFDALLLYGKELIKKLNYDSELYNNYALSNEQEFWASSVELFFEQPTHLQQHYPLVYSYVSKILGWG